ncbi:MAG: 6-carboxytetrahydropterin synthase [bacterium]|nr:6-carboxytetrahydropterin synthase [bacterium]
MDMILLTRKARFCASHRLHNPDLTDQENEEIYGLCNNLHGHGHNYDLEVTIIGEPDPRTGMIMDLKKLRDIIAEEVIDHFDHKHLNIDVPFMKDLIPTAENIAVVIWGLLENKIPAGELHEVKLYESDNNYVIYRGKENGKSY